MKRFFIYSLVFFFTMQTFAQSDFHQMYYYSFKIYPREEGMWSEYFYGISLVDKDIPSCDINLESFMNNIYKSIDCCRDTSFGLHDLPDSLLKQENYQDEILRTSGLWDESYPVRIELKDSTKIMIEKYSLTCKCHPTGFGKTGDSNSPVWYYKKHKMQWYSVYDIQKVKPCILTLSNGTIQ